MQIPTESFSEHNGFFFLTFQLFEFSAPRSISRPSFPIFHQLRTRSEQFNSPLLYFNFTGSFFMPLKVAIARISNHRSLSPCNLKSPSPICINPMGIVFVATWGFLSFLRSSQTLCLPTFQLIEFCPRTSHPFLYFGSSESFYSQFLVVISLNEPRGVVVHAIRGCPFPYCNVLGSLFIEVNVNIS